MLRPHWKFACLAFVGAACGSSGATAAENGQPPYPPGASSVFIGVFPPFPGLYLLNQSYYFNYDQLDGPDGKKLPVPYHSHGATEAPRLLDVWNIRAPGNGVILSQVILPIVNLNNRVGPLQDSTTGVAGLIITPVAVMWTLGPHLTSAHGIDFSLPAGYYHSGELANLSSNYFSFQPVDTIRYDNPKGLDIGVSSRLAFNTENNDTDYRSGNSLILDYEAGWNFGNWKPGITGSLWHQFTDDTVKGQPVAPNGNQAQTFSFGPSLTLSVLPFVFNINWQHDFIADNTPRGDTIWFNAAIPITLLFSPRHFPPGGPPHD